MAGSCRALGAVCDQAEELALLEILIQESENTNINFATVALLKRARTFADSGHDPDTIQAMLESDGFTNVAEKLRYGKVQRELKEIADRARERQSSRASETAARADEINRAAVTYNSAGGRER